jgi:hypothetical protein
VGGRGLAAGWKDLGGKDTTTAGYWLCHLSNDTSVAGNDCVGLSGLDNQIIIFPDTPGKNEKLNKDFVCFMDGKLPRSTVEGEPFCHTDGFGIGPLFTAGAECDKYGAYKSHSFVETTDNVSDTSFYALKLRTNGDFCKKPGYLTLTVKKPRWPAYSLNQLQCYDGVFLPFNPAGMRSRCGQDMEEWLDLVVPVAEPNGHAGVGGS